MGIPIHQRYRSPPPGLPRCGLRPAVISGTSGGALVGALYAAGKTPEQLLD
ncbi:MAG: patatin-like phospholipase family protein, partial [Cardiobacterium sp.]